MNNILDESIIEKNISLIKTEKFFEDVYKGRLKPYEIKCCPICTNDNIKPFRLKDHRNSGRYIFCYNCGFCIKYNGIGLEKLKEILQYIQL